MRGSYVFEACKVGLAVLGGAIASHLGGFDSSLSLLVIMIMTDITTGIIKAVVKKNLESREMMVGMIRKVLILVCVMLAFEIDKALALHAAEAGMKYNIDLRQFIIVYFVLEEMLSVLENMVIIGVPMPKFIIQFLRVVVDTATNSTPNKIISMFAKIKSMDWLGLADDIKKKEKEEQKEMDEFAKPDDYKKGADDE